MGKQDDVATLVRRVLEDGEYGAFLVVEEGVFFATHERARSLAQRFDRELVRVSGQVSGWLVKNKPDA